MSDAATLIDAAWSELLQTTKPGTWYAENLGTRGHWTNAKQLLEQAQASVTPQPYTPPFLATSALNQPVPPNPPIHAHSADFIGSIAGAVYTNWLLEPTNASRTWLGPNSRCVYRKFAFNDPGATVTMWSNWKDFQAPGCDCTPHGAFSYSIASPTNNFPLPASVQAPFLNGQMGRSDRITYLVDQNSGSVYEGYEVTCPGEPSGGNGGGCLGCDPNRWQASPFRYFQGLEKTGNGYGLTAGYQSASKISTGLGLIRPEEMNLPAGSNFGHALRVNGFIGSNGGTTGNPRYVAPAAGGDGKQAGWLGVPYGARIQLDPAIDIETWPSVQAFSEPYRECMKQILRTMQVYGCTPVDKTDARGAGQLESVWPLADYSIPWLPAYPSQLSRGIPYDLMDKFRVIDWNIWTGA